MFAKIQSLIKYLFEKFLLVLLRIQIGPVHSIV